MLNEIERIANVINEDPNVPPVINESSLGKIYQHAIQYDCAIISASRGDPSDNTMCVTTRPHSTNPSKMPHRSIKFLTNAGNNRLLYTRLRELGATLGNKSSGRFIVIEIRGAYIENFNQNAARHVRENAFFVADKAGDFKSFKAEIVGLGEQFCQDSVLISPQGAASAYLVGTNYASFPGYQNESAVGQLFLGDPHGDTEFHTTLGKRPLRFAQKFDSDLPSVERPTRFDWGKREKKDQKGQKPHPNKPNGQRGGQRSLKTRPIEDQ